MNTNDALRITPRLIVGLGILAIGLLWSLDNLDVLEAEHLLVWWPLILVLAGVARLANPAGGSRIASVLFIVVGMLLLLDSFDVIDFDFGDLVPLAIAAVGAKIVWDAMGRRGRVLANTDPSSTMNAFALMAGVHRQSTAGEFHGGDASAIMGGVELDLRQAKLADGQQAVIDTFAFWGGIEITVPPHWRIRGNVMPLMGGFDDKTVPTGETGPELTVRGTAIMGAVVVKN